MLSASGPYGCPACAWEGTETFLGREPFAAQRLQPDFSIDSIIRKLFPPDVRWHLERMQCKVHPLKCAVYSRRAVIALSCVAARLRAVSMLGDMRGACSVMCMLELETCSTHELLQMHMVP